MRKQSKSWLPSKRYNKVSKGKIFLFFVDKNFGKQKLYPRNISSKIVNVAIMIVMKCIMSIYDVATYNKKTFTKRVMKYENGHP